MNVDSRNNREAVLRNSQNLINQVSSNPVTRSQINKHNNQAFVSFAKSFGKMFAAPAVTVFTGLTDLAFMPFRAAYSAITGSPFKAFPATTSYYKGINRDIDSLHDHSFQAQRLEKAWRGGLVASTVARSKERYDTADSELNDMAQASRINKPINTRQDLGELKDAIKTQVGRSSLDRVSQQSLISHLQKSADDLFNKREKHFAILAERNPRVERSLQASQQASVQSAILQLKSGSNKITPSELLRNVNGSTVRAR